MTFNSHTATPTTHKAINGSAWISQLASTLTGFAVSAKTTAGATLRAVQTGRMISMLSTLSDRQLAEIGITRSEIPQYSADMIKGAPRKAQKG
ncbi:DUF1127 domain-containing protein [Roseovarius aestuarii]|nr:DUF1127 domain-containing protein [Roseovarius aestuarii]